MNDEVNASYFIVHRSDFIVRFIGPSHFYLPHRTNESYVCPGGKRMFHNDELELRKLQEQLDREHEILDRARKSEEHHADAPHKFCMTELFAIIPGCDTAPIRIGDHRS